MRLWRPRALTRDLVALTTVLSAARHYNVTMESRSFHIAEPVGPGARVSVPYGRVLPSNAPAWIDRFLTWLEPFEGAFRHRAQRGAFRRYLLGLLSDSPRKSMSAMLARVSEPGSYQAFQHFITDAPWDADRLWHRLRVAVPSGRAS